MSTKAPESMSQWLLKAIDASKTDQEITEMLVDSGWRTDHLADWINDARQTIRLTPHESKPMVDGIIEMGLEPPLAYAKIANEDGSNSLIVGGRKIDITLVMNTPDLMVLDNVLSDEECDHIIDLASRRMQRSLVVSNEDAGSVLHDARTSTGTSFAIGETETIAKVEKLISEVIQWPETHGENMQCMNYQPGQEYKPHWDYFSEIGANSVQLLGIGGNRIATFIIYLNDVEAGGETIFPDVSLKVKPKKGRAVFFAYPRAVAVSKTLHGGTPVVQGEKWICTKWFRKAAVRQTQPTKQEDQ